MKRHMLGSILMITSFLATGVADLSGSLASTSNNEKVAEIYLLRAKSVNLYKTFIELDGDELPQLRSGQHTIITVPADPYNREHSIVIGRSGSEIPVRYVVNMLCEPGDQYFILIHWNYVPALKYIPKQEAREIMQSSTFVTWEDWEKTKLP